MSQALEPFTSENEATYESLISLIENNQDRLALIIVACDDLQLRQRIIDRYELEARQEKIRPFRIVLGNEPSLRSGLAKLAMKPGDTAVVTVTGAEWLLRVTIKEGEEQSDLDKFFGYLQWTREGLREFRVPIVLWVTHRILRKMSRQAPDFWSWRKAVLRFASQEVDSIPVRNEERHLSEPQSDDEFLPPLQELLLEIRQLESSAPESPNLATLYSQLGRVYARQISGGKAANLEQERQLAIDAFQNSIDRHQQLNNQSELVGVLRSLGEFLDGQSRYEEAIAAHRQSLAIACEIGDRIGESTSLINLGYVYNFLGQYSRAIDFYQGSLKIASEIASRENEGISLIGLGNAYYNSKRYQRASDFYQQSLGIAREIGDRIAEAQSLGNLGNTYYVLGEYLRAIDFHQQSLGIAREIGNRIAEAQSLGSLGNTYYVLEQYQRAIDFYQKALEIRREIGARHGEADSLFNKALALAKYEPRRFEALATLQQACAIYAELKLDYMVEQCNEALYGFNRIIATEQHQSVPTLPVAPTISPTPAQDDWWERSLPNPRKARTSSQSQTNWILWFCVGLAIVLLIAWLRK
ncbi:tetratricopeptide repeat protein [Leptolyngbya boryana CZ1]|uniref:Tetratricopeptide repeat protein n=1 Tax=Leptolyngbya boryana CZ1 TaxID=3060204 RepID=A0AA97AMD0_LEPBY|nr:tetratricopeptide repeat protein [Leptolyngbya boryana]WNZ44768.1 tetratricopeptide repeat protein [Leptolyngbya boryana CZ1]